MKNMKTLRVKMVGLLATALILFSAFRADKPVITIFMICLLYTSDAADE